MRRSLGASLLAACLVGLPLQVGAAQEFTDSRLERIADPLRTDFPAGWQAPSAEEMRSAILSSMAMRGWSLESETPGRMELSISVRDKHKARIELTYQSGGYSIRYLESTNLLYDEKAYTRNAEVVRAIHRNYNQWIRYLALGINAIMGVPGAKTVGR